MTTFIQSTARGLPWLALLLSLAAATPTSAQTITITAGPSIPQGAMGERRSVGAHVSVSISPKVQRRGFLVRADVAQTVHLTRSSRARQLARFDRHEGLLSAASAMGYLLFTGADDPAVHAGLGLGAYTMSIAGRKNPYDWVPGIGFVLGMTFGQGRVRGVFEVQQQVIVSDFGNGEYQASTFVPIRIGVSLVR